MNDSLWRSCSNAQSYTMYNDGQLAKWGMSNSVGNFLLIQRMSTHVQITSIEQIHVITQADGMLRVLRY